MSCYPNYYAFSHVQFQVSLIVFDIRFLNAPWIWMRHFSHTLALRWHRHAFLFSQHSALHYLLQSHYFFTKQLNVWQDQRNLRKLWERQRLFLIFHSLVFKMHYPSPLPAPTLSNLEGNMTTNSGILPFLLDKRLKKSMKLLAIHCRYHKNRAGFLLCNVGKLPW